MRKDRGDDFPNHIMQQHHLEFVIGHSRVILPLSSPFDDQEASSHLVMSTLANS